MDLIGHLFDMYVKINADFQPEHDEFKAAGKRREDKSELGSKGLLGEVKAYSRRMEDGDEETLQLWRHFQDPSVERYNETYSRLGSHVTDYSGESQVK